MFVFLEICFIMCSIFMWLIKKILTIFLLLWSLILIIVALHLSLCLLCLNLTGISRIEKLIVRKLRPLFASLILIVVIPMMLLIMCVKLLLKVLLLIILVLFISRIGLMVNVIKLVIF